MCVSLLIGESDQGVAAGDTVGVLFFAGNKHDDIPTVFDEWLLELFVNIKIGNDFITFADGFDRFVDGGDLDNTLFFIEVFIHQIHIEIVLGCYGEVEGVFALFWCDPYGRWGYTA